MIIPGLLMISCVCAGVMLSTDGTAQDLNELTMWYEEPAETWEEALPLGNGRMGAMVYGGVTKERIRLNEESLWGGTPVNTIPPQLSEHLNEIRAALFNEEHGKVKRLLRKYMAQKPTSYRPFQPLGSLILRFPGLQKHTNYRRELNMQDGITRTTFQGDGNKYKREVFVSAPDDVVVVRLEGSDSGTINTRITLSRSRDASVQTVANDVLVMNGQIVDEPSDENPGGSGPPGEHMRFAARLKAQTAGGSVRSTEDEIHIQDASSATILLTAATDYDLKKMNMNRTKNPKRTCQRILETAADKSYSDLRRRHVEDHRTLFNRVKLELGDSPHPERPTDKRLNRVRNGALDPELIELYFQFGRYLLMASSRRPGRLPANLQGIWSDEMWPPWEANYHMDLNLQMNYWPANSTNLSETIQPLADFTKALSKRGQKTAREMYNAGGWTTHLATNVFGRTTPTGSTIGSQLTNGVFPLGGAWLTLALWRNYEFTGNRTYLKQVYPVLRGSARFVMDFLVEGPEGHLVTAPSMSPENDFVTSDGTSVRVTYAPTMDVQIIHELLQGCIAASRILERDEQLRQEMQKTLDQLPPLQIGENGTIQEWIKDYREADPGHRHISHLLSLYPEDWITPDTPKRFEAAQKTLDRRLTHGAAKGGWSMAWAIGLDSRLRNGERAVRHLKNLIQKQTFDNLFNRWSDMFQIDGNFGATAGIAEMLLQSHRGQPGERVIDLLPALPSQWKSGQVSGLRARGDFTVNIEWENGQSQKVNVKSGSGNVCRISYGSPDQVIRFPTKSGKTYVITELKKGSISACSVKTETGETVDYRTASRGNR